MEEQKRLEESVATMNISDNNQQHEQDFEDEDQEDAVAGVDVEMDGGLGRCVLEDFTRCSESHLWRLMMSFYDRKGVESWSQGIVPHFITCNAFIGRSYANVLYGYLRDLAEAKDALDPSEPFYIIELGAGSGKFSFFMLKALEEMRDICPFPAARFIYVMTDFTEQNFKFWVDHPSLRPFLESGQLEMAIFDAVNDTTIRLSRSGLVLAPGTVKNPMCIVANYLFDTLCHDIFQVDQGVLKEGLISVGSKRPEEPDPLDPEIIQRFDNRFEYRPIDEEYYHNEDGDEAHFRRILHWYVDFFGNSSSGVSILFPIGAMRALRRLCSFSHGRALVISGDKGNNNPEQFRGLTDPHIAVHGSFSVMVNYHAIGAFFTSKGGFALHNPQEEASLKVSAFVLGGTGSRRRGRDEARAAAAAAAEEEEEDGAAEAALEKDLPTAGQGEAADRGAGGASGGGGGGEPEAAVAEEEGEAAGDGCESEDDGLWTGDAFEEKDVRRARRFPHLSAAFRANVERFGPNDFFIMQKCMKEDAPTPTLKSVVALLKLGDWDPDVFYKFRDAILNQVPTASVKLRKDLCRGMPRVWENYYMLDKDKDVAFELGRFYYGIREYGQALRFYHDSSVNIGHHHVTHHNIGLCYYSMGQTEHSLDSFARSLALNPEYEKARSWQQKVLQEIAGRSNTNTNTNPADPDVLVAHESGAVSPLDNPRDDGSILTPIGTPPTGEAGSPGVTPPLRGRGEGGEGAVEADGGFGGSGGVKSPQEGQSDQGLE